jgi:hypothetical protein
MWVTDDESNDAYCTCRERRRGRRVGGARAGVDRTSNTLEAIARASSLRARAAPKFLVPSATLTFLPSLSLSVALPPPPSPSLALPRPLPLPPSPSLAFSSHSLSRVRSLLSLLSLSHA